MIKTMMWVKDVSRAAKDGLSKMKLPLEFLMESASVSRGSMAQCNRGLKTRVELDGVRMGISGARKK